MFKSFSPESKERRRRIKESRKYIFMIDGTIKYAIRVPEKEFKKCDFEGVIYFHHGADYYVFLDWEYTQERFDWFVRLIADDQVLYAAMYLDKDGKTTQCKFERF